MCLCEVELKEPAMKLLIIIATATDNINQNTLYQYFMQLDVFATISGMLMDTESRQQFGFEALFLLSLLLNYRKYEIKNSYSAKLEAAPPDVLQVCRSSHAFNDHSLLITLFNDHSLQRPLSQYLCHNTSHTIPLSQYLSHNISLTISLTISLSQYLSHMCCR
jgi:hypothetical protein